MSEQIEYNLQYCKRCNDAFVDLVDELCIYCRYEQLEKQNLILQTENGWLKGSLAVIDCLAVSHHETGPHTDPEEARFILRIQEIASESEKENGTIGVDELAMRQQLAQSQAECASLRNALGRMFEWLRIPPESEITVTTYAREYYEAKQAFESSSAGRDFLAQYKRIEEALEKSGQLLKELCSTPECIENTEEDCSQCYVNDARMVIHQALAKEGHIDG